MNGCRKPTAVNYTRWPWAIIWIWRKWWNASSGLAHYCWTGFL